MKSDKTRSLLKILMKQPVNIAHLLGFKDMTDLHNQWLKEMVYDTNDRTILAHRGSYKTTCLSVAIALIIILFPRKKIIFLRKTDDDVIEVIKQVANILSTPLMAHIVAILYGVELKFRLRTSFKLDTNLDVSAQGAPQLLGIGTSGSLTGKHADIIITDDIVNTKDRVSKVERDRVKLVYMELQNVLNRGGRMINTGTPWHKEDAISIMPNVEKYDCYSTGLITKDKLADIRSKMTPSLFAANYELVHIASEEAMFDVPKFTDDANKILDGVCHIDASYGGSDGTAFTICKVENNKIYVFGKRWDKHVDKCINEILSLQEKYKAGSIRCETNADKGYLAKELEKKGCFVITYHENMNKFIKISTYLRRYWNEIEFIECTDPEYINEILDYTENASHDDSPDSLASIIRELKGKKDWIY